MNRTIRAGNLRIEMPKGKPVGGQGINRYRCENIQNVFSRLSLASRSTLPGVDVVEQLAREGFVEPCGGDFYVLTEKGKKAIARS